MERRDFLTGERLDPPSKTLLSIPVQSVKVTRLVSPKAKEMIAELRHNISDSADLIDMFHRICDILDELNEQEVNRG